MNDTLYKYNYVFFWSSEDYYQVAFNDILDFDNVRYKSGLVSEKNKAIQLIHLINHSARINKIIKLPFRKSWRPFYFKNEFNNDNPIVFVFHGSYYWMKSIDYFDYLKSTFTNSKIVLFLTDTVESYKKYFSGKYYGDFDIDYLNGKFDLIYSYNYIDVQKYKFIYYPTIYSVYKQFSDKKSPDYDLFFVGKAKDRLETIQNMYKEFTDLGFTCDFFITDVPIEKQLFKDHIHYNDFLSYIDVIHHIENSRGLLEIVQGGSCGLTFRDSEALAYNKNLITNNKAITKLEYSTCSKIYYINKNSRISKKEFSNSADQHFDYKNEFSPVYLLDEIEKDL